MPEAPIQALKDAIRGLHGCDSAFVEAVPVVEYLPENEKVVWSGVVTVFDLLGHPTAARAYAWSYEVPGTTRRKFFAVLHNPPVSSPAAAVRAAIAAEWRETERAEAEAKRKRLGLDRESGP